MNIFSSLLFLHGHGPTPERPRGLARPAPPPCSTPAGAGGGPATSPTGQPAAAGRCPARP